MDELDRLVSRLHAELPIARGDRSVQLGGEQPVVLVEGDRAWIAIAAAGVDGRLAPCDRLGAGAEAVLAAWLAALRVIVAAPAGHWCFAALDVRMPLDLAPGASVEELTRLMLKPQWLGALATPAHRSPPASDLAPPSVAYGEDGSLDAAAIENWWARQLLVELSDVPPPAATLGVLARFCGQVYNGGLASFLLQADGPTIVGAYRALVEVGARKLAERLAAGIEPARRSAAAFAVRRFTAWPDEMTAVPRAASLDELDGHAYPGSWYLIERELGAARTRFVRKHRAALVRDERQPTLDRPPS